MTNPFQVAVPPHTWVELPDDHGWVILRSNVAGIVTSQHATDPLDQRIRCRGVQQQRSPFPNGQQK